MQVVFNCVTVTCAVYIDENPPWCVCQTLRFGCVAHNFGPYLHAHVVQAYFANILMFRLSYTQRFQWCNALPTVSIPHFMSMWMALGGTVTPFLIVLICNNVCVCCKLCFKLLFSRFSILSFVSVCVL